MLNDPRATSLVTVNLLTIHILRLENLEDLRCGYPSHVLRKPIQSLDHRLHFFSPIIFSLPDLFVTNASVESNSTGILTTASIVAVGCISAQTSWQLRKWLIVTKMGIQGQTKGTYGRQNNELCLYLRYRQ